MPWPMKKEKDEELRTLQEREIQEKLYGHYRGGSSAQPKRLSKKLAASSSTISQASNPPANQSAPATQSFRRGEGLRPSQEESAIASGKMQRSQVTSSPWNKDSSHEKPQFSWSWNGLSLLWKGSSAQIIAGASFMTLVVILVLKQLPPNSKLNEAVEHYDKPVINTTAISNRLDPIPVARSTSKEDFSRTEKMSTQDRPAQIDKTDDVPPPPTVSQTKTLEPYYSVQVCTYHTKQDAERLSEKLSALQLPAFYQTYPVRSGSESKLYIVFIGKDPTLSNAQERMSQFRKMPVANDFSDAYVRRISDR